MTTHKVAADVAIPSGYERSRGVGIMTSDDTIDAVGATPDMSPQDAVAALILIGLKEL
ncbi:hypothetical protein RUND412_008763 [Rhizina undulata]